MSEQTTQLFSHVLPHFVGYTIRRAVVGKIFEHDVGIVVGELSYQDGLVSANIKALYRHVVVLSGEVSYIGETLSVLLQRLLCEAEDAVTGSPFEYGRTSPTIASPRRESPKALAKQRRPVLTDNRRKRQRKTELLENPPPDGL